jgi:hypothetical protein
MPMPPHRTLAKLLASGALVGGVVLASWSARAARRDWTGSAACGRCHPGELAAWQATAHATTQRRLAPRAEPRCLACHATGDAPAGPAIAIEVGCESCHGAGAAYAEDDVMRNAVVARALGLADLTTPKARAAVCAQCHTRTTRGKLFDPTVPVHPLKPSPP